jgi:hypothetical protein
MGRGPECLRAAGVATEVECGRGFAWGSVLGVYPLCFAKSVEAADSRQVMDLQKSGVRNALKGWEMRECVSA